jgi:hypothetical protein
MSTVEDLLGKGVNNGRNRIASILGLERCSNRSVLYKLIDLVVCSYNLLHLETLI